MTRVDAHLHLWRTVAGETPHVHTIVPPQTDVPVDWARHVMHDHAMDRAVLVQPVFPGEDNSYIARSCHRLTGAGARPVCVVDPRVPRTNARLAVRRQGCRGLRLRPHTRSRKRPFFTHPSTYPLWEAADRLRIVISLLAGPPHIAMIDACTSQYPDVRIILDHLAYPDPAAGPKSADFRRLLELASHANVFVKVSGYHHFSQEPFPFHDCWELFRSVYDHFGANRLLWGSDFPHVLRTTDYASCISMLTDALPRLTTAEREHVMGFKYSATLLADGSTGGESARAAGVRRITGGLTPGFKQRGQQGKVAIGHESDAITG